MQCRCGPRLDDDEQAAVQIMDGSPGGVQLNRSFTVINESGLCSLVMTSRKASAEELAAKALRLLSGSSLRLAPT